MKVKLLANKHRRLRKAMRAYTEPPGDIAYTEAEMRRAARVIVAKAKRRGVALPGPVMEA